jgi:uncharacterized membrane protein YraQ (UPF0718 family)
MPFLAAATLPDPSRTGDVLMAFLSILFEGAPYILVGTILSGFIDAFLPAKLLDRVLPKNKILATFIAGFLGLFFPVCECAVVPVVRRLVQKGLPLSCAMTYLLSAPIINPIVAVSTLTAFKEFDGLTSVPAVLDATMTIARLSLGYVIAVLVGLLMLRFKITDILRPNVAASVTSAAEARLEDSHTPVTPFNDRLVHAMRTAMRDFLDTGMYFTIGVIITSIFNTQVDQSKVDAFASSEWLAIPSMMSLAFVLSLCSTSDAFIAAPMAAFSMASKLAFLVLGPMMDVKLIFMYSAVFKRRVVIGLFLGLFLLIGLLSGPWIALMEKLARLN